MDLNCAIIDDEQFSIDAIVKYINLFPGLKLKAAYINPVLALQEISSGEMMDIIFLDVDMPNINGIELAFSVRRYAKKLIFTTAHSRYAFAAYEAEGDAFLLKPYSFAKFSATINRLFPLQIADDMLATSKPSDSFLVKNKDEDLRIVSVRYADIIAFESSQNYVKIYLTGERSITAYLTIKDVMELVKHRHEFLQLHRAFVVNTDQIVYIEKDFVNLADKISFHIGESFRPYFNAFLKDRLVKTSRQSGKPA